MLGALGAALVGALHACTIARLPDGVHYACAISSPFCEPGFTCVNGVCLPPETSDAGALVDRLNVMFLTRDMFTGNLGGREGANARCQNDADDAGLPANVYVAWLYAKPGDDLPYITGSFVRPDGELVAPNGEEFETHFLWNLPLLRATGARPGNGDYSYWYGRSADGGLCNAWTSEQPDAGLFRRTNFDSPGSPRLWSSPCSDLHRLLCVGSQRTATATQPPPPDGGTVIWVSEGLTDGTGVYRQCGNDITFINQGPTAAVYSARPDGGGAIASMNGGAPAYRALGPIYRRNDGVVVATSAHALGTRDLQNPITPGQGELRQNWTAGWTEVWTGAMDPESQPPAANQPCRSGPGAAPWSALQLTAGGTTNASAGEWDNLYGVFFVGANLCSTNNRVYCLRTPR